MSTRRPTTPALSFARGFNGTHYFVLMTGSEYGPVAGYDACPGDINVTIDGSPCDALSMLQVCVGVLVAVRGRRGIALSVMSLFPILQAAHTQSIRADASSSLPYGPYQLVLSCHNAQPHTQLLCVTRLPRGTVRLVTAAGSATPAQYDSVEFVLPPIFSSVSPLAWDPSQPTTLVITGERWVVHKCSAAVCTNFADRFRFGRPPPPPPPPAPPVTTTARRGGWSWCSGWLPFN